MWFTSLKNCDSISIFLNGCYSLSLFIVQDRKQCSACRYTKCLTSVLNLFRWLDIIHIISLWGQTEYRITFFFEGDIFSTSICTYVQSVMYKISRLTHISLLLQYKCEKSTFSLMFGFQCTFWFVMNDMHTKQFVTNLFDELNPFLTLNLFIYLEYFFRTMLLRFLSKTF